MSVEYHPDNKGHRYPHNVRLLPHKPFKNTWIQNRFSKFKTEFHNKPTASFGDRNQRTHQQPSVSCPTDKELDSKSRSRSSKTPVIGITITETVQGGPQRTGI